MQVGLFIVLLSGIAIMLFWLLLIWTFCIGGLCTVIKQAWERKAVKQQLTAKTDHIERNAAAILY